LSDKALRDTFELKGESLTATAIKNVSTLKRRNSDLNQPPFKRSRFYGESALLENRLILKLKCKRGVFKAFDR
jgi:hypothetical protein